MQVARILPIPYLFKANTMKILKKLSIAIVIVALSSPMSAQHVPANIGIGDTIPELVWSNGRILQNVRIVNNVAGRVILAVNGETEAVRLDEFKKMVEVTNSSLDKIKAEQAAAAAAPPPPPPPSTLTPSPAPSPTPLPTPGTPPATNLSPGNPFGAPTAPAPAPTLTPAPIPAPAPAPSPAPAPMSTENPFGPGAVVTPAPTTPTPTPTPALPPAPVSPPLPGPVPTPEPVTAPTPTPAPPPSVPTNRPRPGSAQMDEPHEVSLLRKSIHGRMAKLQETYIASLEELRIESQGDAEKASQIEAAIERAKRQQNGLQKIFRDKAGQGGGRFRGGPAERYLQDQQDRAMQAGAPVPPTPTVPTPQPETSTFAPPIPPQPSPPEPATTETSATPTPAPSSPEYPVPPTDGAGKPVQNSSGTVPAVMASIAAEGQPGLKAQNIQKWGQLQQELSNGKQYWTVEIDYMADSIFGIFPARAKAFIEQNKVVKWETLAR